MRAWVAVMAAAALAAACRGQGPERSGRPEGSPAPGAPSVTEAAPKASAEDVEDALSAIEEPRESTDKLTIPPELALYPDRKRFLAIQIADAEEERYTRPHDLAALAQLIQKGEVAVLPPLGADYVLDDVGADAHENPLSHYDVAANREVPLYGDATAVREAEARLAASGSAKDAALRAVVSSSYGNPQTAALLFAEHAAITSLARTLDGGPYDLADPADAVRLQERMLSSLRPEARDTLLALAKAYHEKFGRLLPIVSLIRTERYQRRLAHVNPNATHVAIAPHTTGEAFDITFRYMGTDEQNFVMQQIAALEDAGRVEATRERRNCYHVFTFADGHRPPETAIASARDEVNPEAALDNTAEPRRHPRRAGTRAARAARAARGHAAPHAAARSR